MLSPQQQRRLRWVAILLAALLPASGHRLFAAGRPAPGLTPCQAVVSGFLARAPLMRRTDERIARLLDGRHYGQAVAALRFAVSRYPDAWAANALGDLYRAGLGVPRSAADAFHWYLWSAQRGDRFAQRQVANAYLDGEGTQRNAADAAYWFRIGIAPFQVARMYYGLSGEYTSGHLVPVNQSKASYYLNQSVADLRALAKEPNGEAAYYLGLAYEYGDGVPRDRTQALGYLCRAASLQYAAAMSAIRGLRGRGPSR
ncbi:MAG: tetratricopeptide repeat protein [Steroidobacteraceae bacterium]